MRKFLWRRGKKQEQKMGALNSVLEDEKMHVFNSCNILFRIYVFLLVDISASLCGWSKEIKSLLRVIQIT